MTLLFVGQAPSRRSGTIPFAGSTGDRLAKLCGFRNWSSLHHNNFWATNVIKRWRGKSGKGDRFNPTKEEVDRTWAEIRFAVEVDKCSHVVIVGKAAAAALGFYHPILKWMNCDMRGYRVQFMIVPHTSGVNRFYNDPSNRRRTAIALRKVVRRALAR